MFEIVWNTVFAWLKCLGELYLEVKQKWPFSAWPQGIYLLACQSQRQVAADHGVKNDSTFVSEVSRHLFHSKTATKLWSLCLLWSLHWHAGHTPVLSWVGYSPQHTVPKRNFFEFLLSHSIIDSMMPINTPDPSGHPVTDETGTVTYCHRRILILTRLSRWA